MIGFSPADRAAIFKQLERSIQAIYLHDGYSRSNARTGWYRDLTVDEAKRLGYRDAIYAVDRNGNVRDCRLNGNPKTWKTRPGCVLPLKYGLRECFRVGDDDLQPHEAISQPHQVRAVVPVKAEFSPDTPAGIVTDWVLEHEIKGV